MKFSLSYNLRLLIFFFILIAVCCSPIWGVEYFLNQDGSGHIYSASLIIEILKNNPFFTKYFAINLVPVPNSSGHWILVFLLQFFSPFVVTKIIVTITFAGFVAAVGWFRYQTVGREGLKTSLLIGAAMGFNWLWLLGFYNFVLSFIGLLFTLGLFFHWREKMNLKRTVLLAILLVLVYFSHLIGFAILAGSIALLSLFVSSSKRKSTVIWTATAFVPTIPLIILYKFLSEEGGGFSPVWRSLTNPFSIQDWFLHLRAADPFILISRKTLPFFSFDSSTFAIFSPILWLILAFTCLFLLTVNYYKKNSDYLKNYYPFIILFAISAFLVIFSPDDFQLSNGGLLRQRFLLCGLLFLIPLYRFDNSNILKRIAWFCLIFVIVFQTFALWDYSLEMDRDAHEFLSARQAIQPNESLASVVLLKDSNIFYAQTLPQLDNYFGVGNNILIWDNYELGYYLFPVITKSISDREFIYKLEQSHWFSQDKPESRYENDLSNLKSVLESENNKIDIMLVWGSDPQVENVLSEWFESEPFFKNGNVRLFHHK